MAARGPNSLVATQADSDKASRLFGVEIGEGRADQQRSELVHILGNWILDENLLRLSCLLNRKKTIFRKLYQLKNCLVFSSII